MVIYRAIAIRPEQVPSIDWNLYQSMIEAVRTRKDIYIYIYIYIYMYFSKKQELSGKVYTHGDLVDL